MANTVAIAEREVADKEIVDIVLGKIMKLEDSNQLHLPENYSAANALRSAWLIIQETKDIEKRSALEVCTKASICNALFNTVVQGLSPAKKQVYYIVYGNQLQASRSYFGTLAVLKRIPGVKEVFADVVYKGDEFKTKKCHGTWVIQEHNSSFENIDTENIVAAYCTIVMEDESSYTEIMNMRQIQTSWNKSKTQRGGHKEFPDQMAKRTVINRACKIFINSSDDSDIMLESFEETGDHYEEASDSTVKEVKTNERLAELNAQLSENIPSKERQKAKSEAIEIPLDEIKESDPKVIEPDKKEEEVLSDEDGQVRID